MLDTLELTRKLVGSGVHQKQAEAHVENISTAIEHLATKDDLDIIRLEMKLLESRLTTKMITIQITVNSAFIGLFVLAKHFSDLV